jgi:hypothetical protein
VALWLDAAGGLTPHRSAVGASWGCLLVGELDLDGLLREHASRHSVPGAALGILRDGETTTAHYGLADPDSPTMTFGAFDASGRPGVLYQMLWDYRARTSERERRDSNPRPPA